jgi:hypothetical protein
MYTGLFDILLNSGRKTFDEIVRTCFALTNY